MRVINWNHPHFFGPSLGAIASAALATEYIDTHIEPIKIKVPEWYKETWPIFLPEERINPKALDVQDTLGGMNELVRAYGHYRLGWLESLVQYCGYINHKMIPFTPRNSLPCNKNSNTLLVYPREHHNKNLTYKLEYWIGVCNKVIDNGMKVVAILHDSLSHRDKFVSTQWCDELRKNVNFENVYSSTIPNLFRAIQECSHCVGTMTGPSWICLKSDIKQVALSSHSDEPRLSNRPEMNLHYFTKPILISKGDSIDWIDTL